MENTEEVKWFGYTEPMRIWEATIYVAIAGTTGLGAAFLSSRLAANQIRQISDIEEEKEEADTITIEEDIITHNVYTNGFDPFLAAELDAEGLTDDRVYRDVTDIKEFVATNRSVAEKFRKVVSHEFKGITARRIRNLEKQLRRD